MSIMITWVRWFMEFSVNGLQNNMLVLTIGTASALATYYISSSNKEICILRLHRY